MIEEFIIAAFRDLTLLKNPGAMTTFRGVRRLVRSEDTEEVLMWARTCNRRSNGSAVIVLHVSNLGAFERLITRPEGTGDLLNGTIRYLEKF